jgi:hypothetical protein
MAAPFSVLEKPEINYMQQKLRIIAASVAAVAFASLVATDDGVVDVVGRRHNGDLFVYPHSGTWNTNDVIS